MDSTIVSRIALEVGLPEETTASVVELYEKGTAAPFILRYRKDVAGALPPPKVRAIQERMWYYRELLERRTALLKLLGDQKKLSDEFLQRINRIFSKVELEDLFHAFRPRKRSRATEALEKGLGPLAEYIWNQEPDAWSLEEHADVHIDPEKQVTSREQALQGASDIIAEWISDDIEVRRKLREMLWTEGMVVSTVVPAKANQKTKYNMYYDRREPVSSIPSHRVLAIRRGSKEGILTSAIQGDHAKALEFLLHTVIRDKESFFAPVLEKATRDSYNRILRPLIETEVRAMLKERADREAIRVFQENLTSLLMSPAAGAMTVIGIDSAKPEEFHLAVVNEKGAFVEEVVVSPLPPRNDLEGTRAAFKDLITRHGVRAVALGSNASARELESVLRRILAEEKLEDILLTKVNDTGLAVYAASRTAREEFPEMSSIGRSAVSVARRLQDPLAELVKIDPKLIGVGQYQHDVDQKELHRGLAQTVQACVNEVGVDVNTAGPALLRSRGQRPFPCAGCCVSGSRAGRVCIGPVHWIPARSRWGKSAGPHRGPSLQLSRRGTDGRQPGSGCGRPGRKCRAHRCNQVRRDHRRRCRSAGARGDPRGAPSRWTGPQEAVRSAQIPRKRRAGERPQRRYGPRRNRNQRHQFRRLRGHRHPPGRTRPPQPDVHPLHTGSP